jgi:hypothetical protein
VIWYKFTDVSEVPAASIIRAIAVMKTIYTASERTFVEIPRESLKAQYGIDYKMYSWLWELHPNPAQDAVVICRPY